MTEQLPFCRLYISLHRQTTNLLHKIISQLSKRKILFQDSMMELFMASFLANQNYFCYQSYDYRPKVSEGMGGKPKHYRSKRVSMGKWLLRLTVNILAFSRLTVNFFPLRLTGVVKN